MNILFLVLPGLAAAVLSALMTPVARRMALAVGAIDQPDSRKVHRAPIPRMGGLAVVLSCALVIGAMALFGLPGVEALSEDNNFVLALAVSVLPIFLVSVMDDVRPLRALPKLAAQIAGASMAIYFGIRLPEEVHLFGDAIPLGVLAVPITLLWIVGVTNAFNLVDGLDGLSAGLALVSALSLAGVSALVGLNGPASLSIVLAGALVGFLPYNIYPARVFLGDSGAATIGFCLACLALKSSSVLTTGLAVLLPMVVMGLPIAETLVSMVRRSVRRMGRTGDDRGIFDPDRQHFHHRLLDLGLDHRTAVLTLYGVGVLLAACGFFSLFFNNQGAAILLFTMLIAAFIGVKRLGYDEFALLRRRVFLRALDAPVMKAALFTVFVDLALVGAAIYSAIVLKYDDWSLTARGTMVEVLVAIFPAITILTFYLTRTYRGSWRQARLEDLLQSSWAVLVASAIGVVICFLTWEERPPITFFIIYTLILLALVNGARASYRLLFHWSTQASAEGDPVLIYGAGRTGSVALRELLSNSAFSMRPVGFIDDDPGKVGTTVHGYPVIGTLDALGHAVAGGRARGVLVASEKIPHRRVLEAKNRVMEAGGWIRSFHLVLRPISSEPHLVAAPVDDEQSMLAIVEVKQ
jgi:UDP-GlcNAc:undecaprenyl-phosphate GlcNAc-1-phosphate transferase